LFFYVVFDEEELTSVIDFLTAFREYEPLKKNMDDLKGYM